MKTIRLMIEVMKMEFKYAIIFVDEDGSVWRVYKLKNKRVLRDRVSYEIERYPLLLIVESNAFIYSDNHIIKKARKCELTYELDE